MSSMFRKIQIGCPTPMKHVEPEDKKPLLDDNMMSNVTAGDCLEPSFRTDNDDENYTSTSIEKDFEPSLSGNSCEFHNKESLSATDDSYEFLQLETSDQYIPRNIGEVDSRSILRLGSSLGVIGPKVISKEQYGKHKLGSGSLFEVYGHNQSSHVGKNETQNAEWEGFDVNTIVFKKGYVALRRNKDDKEGTTWWTRSRTNTVSLHKDGSAKNQQQEQAQIDAIIREMKILGSHSLSSHRNIIQLLAWGMEFETIDEKSLMTPILVEERALGTLKHFLQLNKLQHVERFNLGVDIVSGLSHLHINGCYHGDINPRNVLLFLHEDGDRFIAKISDFSHAGTLPTTQIQPVWYKGTQGWQAPEVYQRSHFTTRDSVIALESYSFGLVLWSMFRCKGESPIGGEPEMKGRNIPNTADSSLKLAGLPSLIKKTVLEIVTQTLERDAKKRRLIVPDMLGKPKPCTGFSVKPGSSTLEMIQILDKEGPFIDQENSHDPKSLFCPLLPPNMVPLANLLDLALGKRLFGVGKTMLPFIPLRSSTNLSEKPALATKRISYLRNLDPLLINKLGNCDLTQIKSITNGEITPNELFDIAMAAYPYNIQQSLHFLYQAAIVGDVRAQSIYEMLSISHDYETKDLITTNVSEKWLFNGAATGSKFATDFLYKQHREMSSFARYCFREKAGHNSSLHITGGNQALTVESFERFHVDQSQIDRLVQVSKHKRYIWASGKERETPYHEAVLAGDFDSLRKLIHSRINDKNKRTLDMQNIRGETTLHQACAAGNTAITLLLLESGALASCVDIHGITPLHWIFVFPEEDINEVCERLISIGKADITKCASSISGPHFPFTTPAGNALTWAVHNDSFVAVEALCYQTVSAKELGSIIEPAYFETAIQVASLHHNIEILEVLLETASKLGFSIEDIVMKGFEFSIPYVSEDLREIELIATPKEGDWTQDIYLRLKYGNTKEIQRQRQRLTKCILGFKQQNSATEDVIGINTSQTMLKHIVYLNKTIMQGDSITAIRLLQKFKDDYSKDDLGRALYINIENNWTAPSSETFPVFMDIFRGLISAGANVNVVHEESLGNTLFHIIIRKYADHDDTRNLEEIRQVCLLLIKILITCGVKVNALNTVGMSPLDYASHNVRTWTVDAELISLLMNQGAKRTFILGESYCDRLLNGWDEQGKTTDKRLLEASKSDEMWTNLDTSAFPPA